MSKFVNVRLPVIVALSLCAGIGLGILLSFYNLTVAWAALAIVPAAVAVLIWTLAKHKIIKPLIFILLPLLLFIGGALNSYYGISRFDHTQILEDKEYAIHGKVKQMGATATGEYIIISNITANGQKIDGNMYVYLSPTYGELCSEGYTVDFIGPVEKVRPFQYGKLSSYTENNVKYRSSVFAGLKSTYKYNFFASIRSVMRNTLFSNLDKSTAAICYAMLTGNTDFIDEASLDSFRYGGVAHIFAVSGLHIGLIFGIISFILKKLHCNKYISALIGLTFVFLYSALCGFTPSSLRAAIMCAVLSLANLLRRRYDGLNALAAAVILILSITPLNLMSVGFQLSVCAIGGITCFSKYIEKLLTKIKLPYKISSAIGTSLGAQLGTLPIMLCNFGYISAAGLLLNIFVIPAVSVMFIILFVAVVLCSVIGVIAPFVIPYAVLPLQFTISLFVGAGFENALISGFGAGLFAPIYFLFVLGISDKLNLKIIARVTILACGVAILTTYVLIRYNAPQSGYRLIVSAYGNGGEAIIKSNMGTVLIVTDEVNPSRLKNTLNNNYVTEIDALIVLGESNLDVYPLLDIDCGAVYVCNNYPQIQPYGDMQVTYSGEFTVCGADFFFYDDNTLFAEVDGVKIAICADENYAVESCDIFISDKPAKIEYQTQISFTHTEGTLNVQDCGDIIYNIKNGNFRLAYNIPPLK